MLTKKGTELLGLLNQKAYTFNELKYELKCRRDLLTKYLNDMQLSGYDIYRRYYSDGRTKLILPKSMEQNIKHKSYDVTPIVTFSHETEFEALVIADLHIGCAGECVGILDKVYEYATKNGIHIIFGCGDILDGEKTNSAQAFKEKHMNIQEQIEYLVKNYPYDKNILTFTTLGDHERLSEEKNVVDIARAINNSRSDIVVGTQDLFKLWVRNEFIHLTHKHDIPTESFSRIDIYAHYHTYQTRLVNAKSSRFEKRLLIQAPSLSNLSCYGVIAPTMLKLRFTFDKMYISNVYIEELALVNGSEGFKVMSRVNYDLPKKSTENVTMRNVEYYQHEHTSKVLKKTK